jgi:hypothetical protein
MILFLWQVMKALAVFFLCLFFSILNGSKAAHAAGHDTLRSYSPALHVDQHEQNPSLKMRLALLPVRNHLVSEKKESLSIDFDDDDEQEDFIFASKYVLPIAYFITITALSIISGFSLIIKNRLPFCAHFSDTSTPKYIRQRVLRI